MADGKIRITLEARQAIQIAEQLTNQLNNVDRAAGGANQATDKLSASSKKAAESQKALVSSITAINNRVRQLATIGTASNNSLMQLNATVSRMAQSHRDMVTAIQSAVAAMNNLRSAQGAAAQGMASVNTTIEGMGGKLTTTTTLANTLKNMLASIGVGMSLQYATQTLMDFDHAMAQVEAISRASGLALESLRVKAKELGATTIYTSGEAATAMKFLAQSGFDVNEIMEASGPVLALAQAGDIGLAQAAEIAAKALRGFRLDARQMTDVTDVMAAAVTQSTMNIQEMGYAFKYVAPIAASMGVDIREASAYIGVLSDAGIDATMAGTALRRIMSELSNPTIKATKLLAAHGLTLNDVDIKTRGLTETIKTLVSAGLTVGEVFALFGDRGAPAFQTLAQQIEKVEQKTANLQNVTGRAQKMQETMNQSLFAAYKNLTSALEFLIIKFSEESTVLSGVKTAFFSTAEGVRMLARNMDTLAPIFAAIATSGLGKIVAMLVALLTRSKAAEAGAMSLGRTVATQMALVRASTLSASGAMNTLRAATVGTATAMGTTLKAAGKSVLSVFGGWNLAVSGAVAAITLFAMQERPTVAFAEKFDELLQANRKSAEDYAYALKVLQDKIKDMSATRAGEALRELQDRFSNMQSEMDSIVMRLNDIQFVYQDLGNLWGEGAQVADTATQMQAESVKKLWAEYKNGNMTIKDVRAELEQLYREYANSNPKLAQLIASMQQTAESMDVAQDMADKYRVRLAILTGTVSQLDARLQGLANTMENIGLLTGEQLNQLAGDLSAQEWKNYTYMMGEQLNMNKEQFSIYAKQMKYIGTKFTDEQRKLLDFNWTKEGGLRVAVKDMESLTDAQQLQLRQLMGTSKESQKAFQGEIDAINNINSALEIGAGYKSRRTAMDKAETEASKKKTKSAKSYSSAVSKVNEELARMFMTDREFQQFKFEQELAKLQKTLGATNPEFQKLVQLWQKAKELGMSSPKEIMKARTSFEDWLQVQEHGGDQNWTKKAIIDEQAKYLEEFYRDDAQKAVKIKQWAEEEKRKITSGSLQKDTQALLQFWQDYINISYQGEEQYQAVLNQFYQERYQAYLALCNDEVAARKKAEDDKLRASRDAIDGIRVATRDWINENTNMAKQLGTITTNVYDGLADAMTEMAMTGKANWEDLGRTILKELEKMIIKSLILANLMKIMGMIGDFALGALGFGGDTSAAGEELMRQVAKGGVFSGGNVSDYSGSVLTAPTAFNYSREMTQFARGGAVAGEAGWEGILPLGRNSRGELGVKADVNGAGANSGRDVIVNIFNYSNEDVHQESSLDSNGNKTIDVWIGDTAADQMQKPGSNLNRAVRSVTGIKQQVTRR